MRSERSTDQLLAAFVDGVTELSADERRRVEAHLADDPGLREEETATRSVITQLRELPVKDASVDWSALERAIGDAVGPDVPRPWWRRWRLIAPSFALAATIAIIVLVALRPGPDVEVASTPPVPDQPERASAPEPETTFALYLDGDDIEVEIAAGLDEALDDPFDDVDDPGVAEGFLTASDLATADLVDELDDDSLERIEGWLDQPRGG